MQQKKNKVYVIEDLKKNPGSNCKGCNEQTAKIHKVIERSNSFKKKLEDTVFFMCKSCVKDTFPLYIPKKKKVKLDQFQLFTN